MNKEEAVELIEELQEQVKHYKDLYGRIMQEDKFVGKVTAGPSLGLWRVQHEGQSGSVVIPVTTLDSNGEPLPEDEIPEVKIGANVLVNKKFIINVLPDELEVKSDPPKFTFIDWSDVGGMKSQIKTIRDAVENPIKYKDLYIEAGITPIKGMLLYGPPGNGKTLIAKVVASSILRTMTTVDHDSFMYVKGAELLAPYVGVAENSIRTLFYNARKHFDKMGTRSVIFIDEAEAILPKRGSRISSDVETTIVPTFLSEMDGFEDNSPFIILSTNKPGDIDEAVLRPGRIDLKVEIKYPGIEDMIDIFNVHLGKVKLNEEASKLAAQGTKLLTDRKGKKVSGALIATAVKRAVELSISRRISNPKTKIGITLEDLDSSINEITNYHETEPSHSTERTRAVLSA